ncbi:MAG: ribonuclease Z [Salinivirgaceae bacterium]|jgi:ribonuclease Z|nr:ribonuclease Z [Salinivirgaceae bacterium]
MRFELTILGSGSALPTTNRNTTAQVLNVLERFFLIDCGEATQLQLRKYGFAINRINHILISHLHGDHFFGLFGLISSMALLGRTNVLHIYSPPGLEGILNTVLNPQFEKTPFPIQFHSLADDDPTVIFEDKVVTIHAFPLRHSVSVYGFFFQEKKRLQNIRSEKITQYKISIPEILAIKEGADLVRENETVPNSVLTIDPLPPRSYAFVTDTIITRKHTELIKNADLLYHEATFLHADKALARKTMHTTAKQAAEFARELMVGKLILGHFSSRYKSDALFLEEANNIFQNSIIGTDGLKITVPE